MYNTNKIVNKILGSPIKMDGRSRNKKDKEYCTFCGKYKDIKDGKFFQHQGSLAFSCKDCMEDQDESPDWMI